MQRKEMLKDRAREMREADPTRTNVSIATALGVGETTVRRWFREIRQEEGLDFAKKKKINAADFQEQIEKLEPESADEISAEQAEIDEFTATIKEILEAEWSVRFLEQNNVPMKLIPELLNNHMKFRAAKGWVRDHKGLPAYGTVPTTLSYLVSLFRDYPEITTDEAQRIALKYVTTLMYEENQIKKEKQLEEVRTQLRFEPWKNKELAKAYKDYVKNFQGRS